MNTSEVPSNAADPVDDPELVRPAGSLYEREYWGISRHELIAGAAEEQISAKARQQVERLLQPLQGVGLADIAGWADRMKTHQLNLDQDDPDTVAFLQDMRNRNHDTWHYVNLPLGAEEYSREKYPAFTRDDDVVQTIGECTRVLVGQSSRFSELNALRLLVHLAGDVHQPVHVGCCYVDTSGPKALLVRDPTEAVEKHLKHDRGGNNLILPIGSQNVSLHAYWDNRLSGGAHDPTVDTTGTDGAENTPADADVRDAVAGQPHAVDRQLKRRFIRKLSRRIARFKVAPRRPTVADEADATPPQLWAVEWATESLVRARDAYESLAIEGPHQQERGKFIVSWEGKPTYDARCVPIVTRQLELAATNLAALLDVIWP